MVRISALLPGGFRFDNLLGFVDNRLSSAERKLSAGTLQNDPDRHQGWKAEMKCKTASCESVLAFRLSRWALIAVAIMSTLPAQKKARPVFVDGMAQVVDGFNLLYRTFFTRYSLLWRTNILSIIYYKLKAYKNALFV